MILDSGYSLGFKKQIALLLLIEKSRNACLADKPFLWFLQKWIRRLYVWDLRVYADICIPPVENPNRALLSGEGRSLVGLRLCWRPAAANRECLAGGKLRRKSSACAGILEQCSLISFRPLGDRHSVLPRWNPAPFWTSLLYSGFSFQVILIGSALFLGRFSSVWSMADWRSLK